jgi:hypothetical protein
MKARRARSMNKKKKNSSEGLLFSISCEGDIKKIKSTKKIERPVMRLRELSKACKVEIDIKKLDDDLKQKCIDMSLELHYMDPAERMVFMYEEPHFPKSEKTMLLDTCIRVLEQIEDYEVCATLHRLRTVLNKNHVE